MTINSFVVKTVTASFVAVLLSGCGVLWKKKGGSNLNPAPFSLNETELKNFEAWKQALVKDCSTQNAFEGQGVVEDRLMDLGLFLAKTGNSLALRDGDSFVLFGYPLSPLGTSVAELNRSQSINGNNAEFGAVMKRDGAHCVVEVNGETVYETYLFRSFPVTANGAGVITKPEKSQHLIQTSDDGVLDHGAIASVNSARIQKEKLTERLKAFLPDLTDDDRSAFFPIDGSSILSGPHAADIGGFYISSFSPQIPRSVVSGQDFGDSMGEVTYTLSVLPSRLKFTGAENTGDTGLWQLEITVAWQATAGAIGGRTYANYEVKSMRWLDPVAFEDARVSDCILGRHAAFAPTQIHGQGTFAPSYGGSVGPCDSLAADGTFADVLYKTPATKSLIVNKFAGVSGGGDLDRFLGWDIGLDHIAKAALADGADIKASLDPKGTSPLIGQISSYANAVSGAALSHEATKEKSYFFVSSLAFPWAFRGHTVTADTISAILAGIANTVDPFLLSVNSWTNDLVANPSEQHLQIAYAKSVDEAFKAEVRSLRETAKELGLMGVFDSYKLHRVIQDRIDLGAGTAKWRATLSAISAFHARDKARVGDRSQMTFDSDFSDLAKVAIEEDWTDVDFALTEKIAAFTQKDSFCSLRTTVSSQVDCAGSDLFSKKSEKFLNPAFGDRYGTLAGEFAALYDKLGTDHVFVRGDLQRDFWKPIWKECDNGQFNAHSARLKTLIDNLLAADAMSRFDIQRDIDALLDECDH